jgi:hypothetical protein
VPLCLSAASARNDTADDAGNLRLAPGTGKQHRTGRARLGNRCGFPSLSAMDRAVMQQRLLESEAHVALGAQHIERQRIIIDRFETLGIDSFLARRLLWNFEGMQAVHLAERDRLAKALVSVRHRNGSSSPGP